MHPRDQWMWSSPRRRARFLWPEERLSLSQVWGLHSTWESHAYYPAGGDAEFLSAFNVTVGFNRRTNSFFALDFAVNWTLALRPFSLAAKLHDRIVPARSNVTMLISNCRTFSKREVFLQELMGLIAIDSFGGCLGNREEPLVARKDVGWHTSLHVKHAASFGYKFVIAFENTIEYGEHSRVGCRGAACLPVTPAPKTRPAQ
jgi:hypothetical protein